MRTRSTVWACFASQGCTTLAVRVIGIGGAVVVAGVATAEALMAGLVALKVLNASTQARCHGWRVFDLIVSLSGDALTASAMPPVPPADGPPKSSVAVRDLMERFFVKSALTTMSLFRRTECRHRRRLCGGVVRNAPCHHDDLLKVLAVRVAQHGIRQEHVGVGPCVGRSTGAAVTGHDARPAVSL